jgi:hypothetical protein
MPDVPYQQELDALEAALAVAILRCNRYAKPSHAVGNCPSDLQNYDQAWRERQRLEYQIAELKKDLQITIDFCLALDK